MNSKPWRYQELLGLHLMGWLTVIALCVTIVFSGCTNSASKKSKPTPSASVSAENGKDSPEEKGNDVSQPDLDPRLSGSATLQDNTGKSEEQDVSEHKTQLNILEVASIPCINGQQRNPNGVCKAMPLCPKRCTIGRDCEQHSDYQYQKVNGLECAYTFPPKERGSK